jgi:hypothetical protein
VVSLLSVGVVGTVIAKKVQTFNSEEDVYEAFIDSETA